MLTLVLGTDWKVNTDTILSLIADDVADEKPGRVLMVPELISHEMERRLCAAAGDTCSRFAEVLSFTRLANRVADSVGHTAQVCLDNGGRVVAMASAAQQLHSKLKAYASVETRPEFLEGLVDVVDEFKRCCISPEDLLAAAGKTQGSFAQKLEELSLLYECYNSLCQRGKKDPRDQMTWLLEQLQTGDFGEQHVFYIDGFPDFTRQHMQIIFYLLEVSEHVTVSLTCDKQGSNVTGFEKAGETASQLLRYAKARGIDVEIRTLQSNDQLGEMRNCLLHGPVVKSENSDFLNVCRVETVYQECQIALEGVLSHVQAGARFKDIAIVCSDINMYHDPLEMLFKRCGVPLYISGTEDILQKPVMSTVLAAMDAALGGFEQQDVLRYLKSPLSPIDLETCDAVENYVLMWGITGSRWQKEWTSHPDGLGKTLEPGDLRLEELNSARRIAIDPLVRLYNRFQEVTTVKQQVRSLYDFFQDISLDQRLSSLAESLDAKGDNRNAQILNQLWDILLTALEQLYDILGETTWETENFTRLFKLLLRQYDVGTIPGVLDAVTAGPVSAMRCQRCKHLFVLGAQEGLLPQYGGSSGVLTDQERTALRQMGVPLTGKALEGLQAEFAEIYGVFCCAEETVSISCSGDQPSVVYRRLLQFAGKEIKQRDILGSALGNSLEAAAYLMRNRAPEVAQQLGLEEAYETISKQIGHTLGTISEENIRKLYGNKLRLSASQVDAMAQCRFYYFLRYGLYVSERKPATIDPAEFGTYVHAVLEETVEKIMEMGGFSEVSLEETLQIAKKFSWEYVKTRFSEIDTQRLNYLFSRNAYELELIVQELWREMQGSAFLPVGFEVGFGDGKEVEAIDVSGKKMQAFLRGYVDRVDLWNDGDNRFFRVVDYKTGKKDFDYCDLYNGYGLQMLLYLFALEQGGEHLLGQAPIPAGVQYFPARVPLVSADGKLTEEEAQAEREKHWKRKGLLLEDERVLQAMQSEDTFNRLPFTKKKDGTLSGDLADSRQFAVLKSYIFSLVGRMVDEVASGCVEPNPYTRGTSHDACAFCPYSQVCHKQDVTGRRNFKAITAQRFWEDVEKEMSNRG